MNRIGLIGYYSLDKELVNGQTIKSKLVYDVLKKNIGADRIVICDYCNWKKKPFHFLFSVLKTIHHSKHIIMFPARNALRVLSPFLCFIKKLLKRKIHYYVVGGWLVEELKNHRKIVKYLQNFDYIYVELNKMKNELNDLGLNNVVYLNKFREIQILNLDDINTSNKLPFKLCTFSRVMKEKGINEAVDAVNQINTELGKVIYTLDIYGQVYPGYEEWFEDLMRSFPSFIKYCGFIDYKSSNQVLKDYFAMLFPTRYYGEGYPNTIVDAFAAGLPVIGTNWNYNNEVVQNGIDGLLYDSQKTNELKNVLLDVYHNPDSIIHMKKNALERAKDYVPDIAIKPLLARLEK